MKCHTTYCSHDCPTDDNGNPAIVDNDGNAVCAPGCKHEHLQRKADAEEYAHTTDARARRYKGGRW